MTNTDIKLNAWNLNYESQIAVQGEVNSRTLTVTLIDKVGVETYVSNAESVDRPIDLTGTAARLYVIKPDGTKTFSDGTIEDAENGIVSFLLPYQATTAAGSADCQILLTKSDNSELKIVGMTLDVLPSNLEGAIESTDEFSALVVALNSIQASIEQVNQAVLESQEAVENANTAISGANTARDSANTAAGLANEAAEAAETATEACVTATENANTATGNTNAAITSANSATTAANTAADRANEAAQNAEDAISGQLDPAIDARIAAKMNIAGGVAGYDNAVAHYSNTSNPHNVTTAQIGAATLSVETSATLPASGWTGSEAPYSQTVSVTGAKPEPTRIEVQPTADATAAQWAAWRAALVRGGGQGTDSITLLADGDKPTVDIPIAVTIRGDVF